MEGSKAQEAHPCRKVKFAREADAAHHIEKKRRTARKPQPNPARPYFCPYCNNWHITSEEPAQERLVRNLMQENAKLAERLKNKNQELRDLQEKLKEKNLLINGYLQTMCEQRRRIHELKPPK
jgi:hypothetical protein